MKKYILSFFALAIMSFWCSYTAKAFDFSAVAPSGQTLYYRITSETTVEVGYQCDDNALPLDGGPVGDLIIPSSVTNPNTNVTYNVTAIGSEGFRMCSNLTSINIPNSVTNIEQGAFRGCINLTAVNIPESVTFLKWVTFESCYNLTSITIPVSVDTIEDATFNACGNLSIYFNDPIPPVIGSETFYDNNANIYVPCEYLSNYQNAPNWSNYSSRIYGAIDLDYSYNFTVNDDALGSISLSNIDCDSNITVTVNTYGDSYRFLGWSDGGSGNPRTFHLVSDTVVTAIIGEYNQLFSAVAPTGQTLYYRITDFENNTVEVTSQNSSVPYYTSGGPTGALTIPASVTNPNTGVTYNVAHIGGSAFTACYSLTSVDIPNTVTSIGYGAFKGCRTLATVNIPNSVTSIGDEAFNNCSSLRSIVIPNSVTSLGYYTFANCSRLNSIVLPDSITSIGYAMFEGCSSLTSVNIPNSVTQIREYAFKNCNTLSSINIPNSVVSIGYEAFNNCDSLTSITIPNSVTYIGSSAFSSCSSLTSIDIPNSITVIEEYTFGECSSLTTVNIPSSVTFINNRAFAYCNSLSSISIPSSVTYIGSYIFDGCWNQLAIYFDSIPPAIENATFNGCNANIYVPCEYLSNYQTELFWSDISSRIHGHINSGYSYSFAVNDDALGSVSYTEINCDSNIVVTVNAIDGYIFAGWNDGNTDNPRTFHVTSDTMATAIIINPYFSAVTPTGQTLNYFIIDNTINSNNVEIIGYNPDERPAGYLIIPDTVINPNTGFVYNVVSIGSLALGYCYDLTSVTIPNSVTHIGDGAFRGCTSLMSINIPESVTFLAWVTFESCALTSINLPSSIDTIDGAAFNACGNLSKIYFNSSTPPTILNTPFEGCGANLYVPCQYLNDYQNAQNWSNYSERIRGVNNLEFSYSFTVNDSTAGSVSFTEMDCDNNVVATVNINEGCQFIGWSDGETDNPRTFHIIGDTTVTAIIYNPYFSAVAPSGQTLKYRITDSVNVEVYNYLCADGALIIPDSVMHPNTGVTYNVTRIRNYAFANCNSLTSVVIPNSVTSIGIGAFNGCGQLSTVEFGNSISSIDESAFTNCDNLDSVYFKGTFPPYVAWYGFNPSGNEGFYVPCQYLSNYLSANNWIDCGIASRTYSNNYDNWEHSYSFVVNDSTLGSVSFTGVCDSNIVVTVNVNEGYQFLGWSDGGSGNPRTFHLVGDTVVTAIIGDYNQYFSAVAPTGQTLYYRITDFNNGTAEVIPQNSESPYYTNGAPSGALTIPARATNPNTGVAYNVVRIDNKAFSNCYNLTSVNIPNTVTSIGWASFENCYTLASVSIPNSVTSIASYAFVSCRLLSSLNIPNSVTSIEYAAFEGCSSLTTVTLPDSITNIAWNTFNGCSSLASVTIPNSVTHIGNSAFANCRLLSSLIIPNSVTSIESAAFESCSSLTTVTLPDSITNIAGNTFYGCNSLTSITIPNTVTTIGRWAFYDCDSLSSVTIPNSVTYIGEFAFYDCSALTSITIPNSVTYIESNIFGLCNNLSKIYFNSSTAPAINGSTFNECNANIYVPCQSINEYQTASNWSNYSSRIHGKNYDWEPSCTFVVNDSTLGSVSFTDLDCDSNVVVTVNANSGYQFIEWTDGNTDNPRTFHITGDTMATAIIINPYFSATAPSGQTLHYRIIDINNVGVVRPRTGDYNISGSLIIPATVTYNDVTYNVTELKTINGLGSFEVCNELTSVTIPNSVSIIGNWAFNGCYNINSIYLENSIPPSIEGSNSFSSCSANFYVPCEYLNNYQNDSGWSNYSYRIYGEVDLEYTYSFTVNDDSLGYIESRPIDCDSNVIVTVIPYDGYRFAVWSDGGLGNPRTFHITKDTMVTATIIDGNPYFSAVAPTGQTLNYMIIDDTINTNSVTVIGYVFEGRPIGELIIPENVINPNTGITYNVNTISGQSFRGCNSLTSVVIPNSVTIIGDGAFQECSNLTSATIGNSVSEIQWVAFRDCGLTSITIPNNVETIGDEAFFQCYNLRKVYLEDTMPPSINQQTFHPGIDYYVPCQSIDTYQSAYFWNNYSSRIYGKNYEWEPSCTFIVSDSTLGSVSVSDLSCDSTIVATVNVHYGNLFLGWNDANTDNPRTFHITGDTMVTAIVVDPLFSAEAPSGQTLYYQIIDNNNVTVVSQNQYSPYYSEGYDPAGALIIPDTVVHPNTGVTYNVTRIGNYAFANCNSLTAVVIPNSVTTIGTAAFDWCGQLSSVEIGDSVTRIEMWAFSGCANIANITLPESVTMIDENAFYSCHNLSKVYAKGIYPPTISSNSFEWRPDFYVPCQHINNYYEDSIWNDISSRIYGMNYDWEYSYNFVVNDSTLGNVEFREIDCDSNIFVTANVYDGNLFLGWSDGETNNPRTLHLIGDTMVNAIIVDPLFSAIAPSGQTLYYRINDFHNVTVVSQNSSYPYYSDAPEGALIIPDSVINPKTGNTYTVNSIGNFAFGNCDSITSVIIPNSVASIGDGAFDWCTQLSNVEFGNSVAHIGSWAFSGCTSLTGNITFPESLRFVSSGAFNENTSLDSVTFSSSSVTIEDDCFWNCYNLSKVYINDVFPPSIGFNTFSGCNADFYVPCESVSKYDTAMVWSNLSSRIHGVNDWNHSYNFEVNDESFGSISFTEIDCDSNVVVTVQEYTGYQVIGWSDGGDVDNPRTFHLTSDTMVTAIIDYIPYTVIGQPNDTLRGVVTGGDIVHYGDSVVLVATSNYGYHFSQWNDGNIDNPRSVFVEQDDVFTAIFDKNNYYIGLGDSSIYGYVTGVGSYEYLDSCSISAIANYGYHFTQWSDGNTDNPRSITLTQDTFFTAEFAKNTYTLTVVSNDSTLGEVFGNTTCEYLDTVNISASVIMPHYHFAQWSDGNADSIRDVVVTSDSIIMAIFHIDTHSVMLAVNNDSCGTVNGMCNVAYGSTVTIEAVASDGYHFVEWSNGSRNNPDNITVLGDTLITAIFTDDVVPQICRVSVQNGLNIISWEKGLEVNNYNIYRESNISDQYELVATVSYDSLSEWVDSTSRPTSRSYRYRMTATDTYGYESESGDVHKTMHLTISKGISNQWNLVWTEYEGADYATYIIYRGTNASNMQQIDELAAGGNTTYTDENAPEGEVYYQVGIVMNTPCNTSKSSSDILSNIATNSGTVGIQDNNLSNINIFTRSGEIIIENALGKAVQVFDIMGRTVYETSNTYSSYEGQINIKVPNSGVYLVKVGEYPTKKVVVVK